MAGDGTEREQTGGDFRAPLFVAAAHELKAPLALVRQLALGLEADDLSPESARILRQITLTSERALRLTTDLTRTARLEDGLFTLEPLNPVSLCQEVIAELTPLYAAKGRDLRLSSRSRPLLGLANRELLRRILINFADNALHYGGDATPVVVSASTRHNGSMIRLGVRDYGPAIATKLWLKNSDAPTKPLHNRPASSGLGLYISKQFAEAMQAEIGATHHRDGVTFYVDINASTQLRLW